VLVVDDDEDSRDLYAWCMKAAGWLVQAVEDGAEALLAATTFEPDVIVMDLRLPILGGLDAIRLLKGHEATKHIPVVACTAFDRRSSEVEAKMAGCDEFVPKPCEPEALRDLLETMVTSRRGSP
jgi:CheY-like chemotaxis protein